MSARRKDDGFTLVEVLIAMFIFALISAGSMTAMIGAMNSRAQVNTRMEALSEIQLARSLIQSDLAQITLRDMRGAQGGFEPFLLRGGADTLLTFTRHGRANPGGLEARSEFQRVSYIFEGGQLIRRSFAQANPAPQTPYIDRVLLSGLNGAGIKFLVRERRDVNLAGQVLDVTRVYQQDYVFVAKTDQVKVVPQQVTLTADFENGDSLVQHFEVRL